MPVVACLRQSDIIRLPSSFDLSHEQAMKPHRDDTKLQPKREQPDEAPTAPLPPRRAPAHGKSESPPLIPARIINEYVYCPRLAYLEWVQGEWADSYDTEEGRRAHRRVDRKKGTIPDADDTQNDGVIHATSVDLSSETLGVVAKMDLVEVAGGSVVPVDYKKGKRPHVPKGAYAPERVQLCVQGLLLREHGYRCDEGVLYYVAGKERVTVPFDEELIQQTRDAIDGVRESAENQTIPPPLEDSPKCPRCSLVGICLPDEVNLLNRKDHPPRPLAVRAENKTPVYVQHHRASVRKKGNVLNVEVEGQPTATARLAEVSQLVAMGNVYITTPTLHELMRRDIPVSWYSYGGWFLGHTAGTGHRNVELRTAQYARSFSQPDCLKLARSFVKAKILNSRTMLRRNWRGEDRPPALMRDLKLAAHNAAKAESLPELLGIEGAAASRYFGNFQRMLRSDEGFDFQFNGRNRRPPKDRVNALLSFSYSLLVRTWTNTISAVGLDPYRGFYHQPRYGRPALALDLMESFRPLVADSSVIQVINNGEVGSRDFVVSSLGVAMKPDARKSLIAAFERRLSQEITHPIFGYRVSYRRVLEIQARLLGRFLLGELPEYPDFTTR